MSEDRQPHLIAAISISLIISVVTTILRFVSRKYIVGVISTDDWLMLVAMLSTIALSIITILMCNSGAGLHLYKLLTTKEKLFLNGKLGLGFQMTYNASVYFAKLSILSFFLMFIPRSTRTRRLTWVTIWLVLIMLPIKLIVLGFQCTPISRTWNPSIPGTCINTQEFLYFVTVYHILTDIAIFILPMRVLAKIKRTKREKLLLFSLFGVSFVVVVIGSIRLYALHILFTENDFTYNQASIIIWSLLECSVGILCGSVPAIKPLFSRNKISDTMTANLELSTAFYELKRRPSGSIHSI